MAKEIMGVISNHFKLIGILYLILSLSGCSILPGMQNPSLSRMHLQSRETHRPIQSTLVPITPSLIFEQHQKRYVYRIAPADVLNIIVWQHPEFGLAEIRIANAPSTHGAAGSEGYLVNPEGDIFFPLIGYLHVAGKSVDEVRKEITHRLRKYVNNPQINVRVADFRGQKIYVVGEIMKQGYLPLNDQPLTITDALTMSGGIDPNSADPSHIYIIRGDFTSPTVYWLNAKEPDSLLLAERFNLQPGDVLYVSSATTTRWNRALNHLLPTLQTIWYTKTITNK